FHLGLKTKLGGVVGYTLSTLLAPAFGFAIYLVPALLLLVGLRLIRSGVSDVSVARAAAALTLVLSLSVLLGLVRGHEDVARAGGWFGGFVGTLLYDACGSLGAFVVAASSLVLGLMFTTGSSMHRVGAHAAAGAQQALGRWRARRGHESVAAANRRRSG